MQLTTASFSGHESFPFRNTWLTKGVANCAKSSTIFNEDEAMVTLGVGKNMVRSIRHWCLATRVLEEDPETPNNRGRHLRPSILGRRLFLGDDAWDRYLEDTGTLWLLHWNLVTNPERATTWYYAFNALHQPEFTKRHLENALGTLARGIPNLRFSDETLRRDTDVFLRTYVGTGNGRQASEESIDCPLAELNLLYEQAPYGIYSFVRGPKDTLPDAVFVYALWDYIRRLPKRSAIAFDDLAYGPLSPGRAFKLDEPSLAERLDRLADLTAEAWQFNETAGYKQVMFSGEVGAIQILDDYYNRRPEATNGSG